MAQRLDARKPLDGRVKGRVISEAVMKDRFYYILSQCVSCNSVATMTMPSGERFTGSVYSLVKGGVILRGCTNTVSKETMDELKATEFQTLEFSLEDPVEKTQAQKFKSDAEITRAKAPGRRALQKYEPEALVQHTLDEHYDLGKFDQFEANQKLFGVTATYNEDQYTTPVVHPEELTPDQVRQAEQIMKALSRSETMDDAGGEMEEEARFAAVAGTGRFAQKPEERKPEPEKIKPEPAKIKPEPAKINTKLERAALEKPPSPYGKEYIRIRDEIQTHRRLTTGIVCDPTRIEALMLEIPPFRNEKVAMNLERFKNEMMPKPPANIKHELEEFKNDFDKRSASRKNSIIDVKGKKEEEPPRESPPLTEIVEEPPASLLDLYLDSLTNTEGVVDLVEPYWPVPVEHRAQTVPPSMESPFLNPDAPEFEFPQVS